MPTITPKSARKNIRRQAEQVAMGQMVKIRTLLEGRLQPGETPAQAVKRLLAEVDSFNHQLAVSTDEVANGIAKAIAG